MRATSNKTENIVISQGLLSQVGQSHDPGKRAIT